jgi:ribosomal subunit interface protein
VAAFDRVELLEQPPSRCEEERVDIVVKARQTEISERFREHVKEKLARIDRFDAKCIRIDVEVTKERNPRLSGRGDRIELTMITKGPVIRAEAAATDLYAALDVAAAKLQERLRRAADRRAGRHSPRAAMLHGRHAGAGTSDATPEQAVLNGQATVVEPDDDDEGLPEGAIVAEGPLIVREKRHEAPAMTLDDALHQMELVGHDFYLYCDAATGTPSVVYRRRGYDYGVLRLVTLKDQAAAPAPNR